MNSDELRQLVQSYNAPPASVPRDEMWARIRIARDVRSANGVAPREMMWERVATQRKAPAHATSGGGRKSTVRISGRDIPSTALQRTRAGWIFSSVASLAAVALFAFIQTRNVPVAAESNAQEGVAQSGFTLAMPGQFAFHSEGLTHYATDFSSRWPGFVSDDPVSEAYRRAATTHLRKSDALIAGFHSLSNDDVTNRTMRTTVRELLSNTRLLLNSAAPIQGQYRGVFLDLEMVLVKMTLVNPTTVASDRAQIETTLARRKLLMRMRDLIPAPSSSNAN